MSDEKRTRNGGPPCPQISRLEELMEQLTELKSNDSTGDGREKDEMLQECVEALDWLHTSLSNRSLYQKKQQIKKKVYLKLAKEVLSKQELEQVEKQVEAQLAEAVANEA